MTGKKWKAAVSMTGIIGISLLTACQNMTGQTNPSAHSQTEAGAVHSSMEISVQETTPVAKETLGTTGEAVQPEGTMAARTAGTMAAQMAGQTSGITVDEAKNMAMDHSGVKKEEVQFIQVNTDWDDGKQLYEVEFSANGKEYDYEISTQDGTIVSYSVDQEYESSIQPGNQTGDPSGQTVISMEQAKEIVAAQIEGIDVSGIYIKQDYDHGRVVYEGDAYYNGTKYEFEIDGLTGKLLEWKSKAGN